MIYEIHKRSFDAKNYPQGSDLKNALNSNVITSEYMTSYKYVVIYNENDKRMGYTTFKTRKEAIEYVVEKERLNKSVYTYI